jgi:uncharacterized protein (TIGR00299 family) protein
VRKGWKQVRAALFDPWSGVSGNMVLGSLLDAGLDEARLREVLAGLPLVGWTMTVSRVSRAGITGTLVEIAVDGDQPVRRPADVEAVLRAAGLPDEVLAKSLEAFGRIALAESAVHGVGPEEVHFHEVGAVDSILDVVGSFAGLHLLGVDRVFSRPVATGFGTTVCSHGVLPVPAPATAILLEGVPVRPWTREGELATPTGVAVLTTAVGSWDEPPPVIRVCGTGMGAGSRDGGEPNMLRLTLGDVCDGVPARERGVCGVLTCVVDDMDPRTWPAVSAALAGEGALDSYAMHCTGRKGRPALELVVICPADRMDALSALMLEHTTTLGVRMENVTRRTLPRSFREVATRWGTVRVKTGELGGRVVSAEPEFEDCARVAAGAGVPVKRVLQEARGLSAGFLQDRVGH